MVLQGIMRGFAGAMAPVAALTFTVSAQAPAIASDEVDFDAAFSDIAPAPAQPDLQADPQIIGSGRASFYGAAFAGRPTASGERFDPARLTAAHPSLPFGSRVRVTNRATGQSVVVRINDRGPYHGSRVIDLSHEAARRIGLVARGSGSVELALLAS